MDKKEKGWGTRFIQIFSLGKYELGVALEAIIWREIPIGIGIRLLEWVKRDPGQTEDLSVFTLIRIQFLVLDIELYFFGGTE